MIDRSTLLTAQGEVVAWRKSTRSGDGANGGNCVEAGAWRKSTRSGSGGNANCLEAAACTDASHGVAVRDTKHRSGPVFVFAREDWTAFVADVKHGGFDA